jgi:hypothetical protein
MNLLLSVALLASLCAGLSYGNSEIDNLINYLELIYNKDKDDNDGDINELSMGDKSSNDGREC